MLNTLFVTSQGAYLARDGETVAVRVEQETRARIPIHTLSGIMCFGQISCSPFLMGLCAERCVGLSFFSEYGRFLARVEGPVRGNVLLRRTQYRWADDDTASSAIARSIVIGKIANARTVLLRALRDHPNASGAPEVERVSKRLARIAEGLRNQTDIDRIRGAEGEAGRAYFSVFDHLITSQKESFRFQGRSRRPPLDSVNALLSFLYVLLATDVSSALEGVGLDPAVGFLHRDRPGRMGLALDIMEELRPIMADRVALTLINRGQIDIRGFSKRETGAVVMDDKTRRAVLMAYQDRKREEVTHAFIEEKVPIGLLPHVQGLLLARYLRGDLDGYPPFRWK